MAETFDFRTPAKKRSDARKAKIVNSYVKLREQLTQVNITASDHQLFKRIADEHQVSETYVRCLCIMFGAARPKRERQTC